MSKKAIWFKAKRYGYGWYPATWQGWVVTVLFLLVVLADTYNLSAAGENPTTLDLAYFFVCIIASVAGLLYIAYKTGEKPGWRWGK